MRETELDTRWRAPLTIVYNGVVAHLAEDGGNLACGLLIPPPASLQSPHAPRILATLHCCLQQRLRDRRQINNLSNCSTATMTAKWSFEILPPPPPTRY